MSGTWEYRGLPDTGSAWAERIANSIGFHGVGTEPQNG